MTDFLIDTHVLLWYLFNSSQLSIGLKKVLRSSDNRVLVSAISFWEIAIKYGNGKLKLSGHTPESLLDSCKKVDFQIIDLENKLVLSSHLLSADYHKDPFDRLLIWQAINNNYILITNDQTIHLYESAGLKTLWI